MYRIGIDLGGTNIAVGVVDNRHNIIAEASVPTGAFRPAEEMVADMCRAVELALDKAGLIAADCASIGIGSPGTCDSEAGTVLRAYNLGWFNVPVCQMLHDRFLQRKSGKIGGNKQFFVRNSFHGICLLYTHTQICFWAESPPDNCIVPYFLCNVNSQIGKIKRKLRRHRNQSRARTDRARRGIRV